MLTNLPAELLVQILSYLPTRDKISAQYVSRRLNDVSKTPLLWKIFLWLDYEPRHLPIVINMLKARGKHVRQIFFPAHVAPANILEMVQCCREVTHLSLPRRTHLTLEDMEKILHMMTHLQQLDVFISSIAKGKQFNQRCDNEKAIKRFLEATVRLKSLILRIDGSIWFHGDLRFSVDPLSVLNALENLYSKDHTLPSVIYLLIDEFYLKTISCRILESWSPSRNTQGSLEIYLYVIRTVPVDIYPSIPLAKFQFGPAATTPLIKLSDYSIQGLKDDTFYLSDYNHYGEVRRSIKAIHPDLGPVKDEHLHYIGNLCSVSNVDFLVDFLHARNILPIHLEQLAFACPNLHRLSLMYCGGCPLQSLQGLRAIVDTCKNLQGLNLVGIPVSQVESYLLLWELLSRIKKLTHLAIGLCMVAQSSNCDNTDKQKLIGMLRSCDNLKALEVSQHSCKECTRAPDVEDLLFCHFPSLVYVKLTQAQYSDAFKYAVTNCQRLKYLCCVMNTQLALPSLSSCHLQQLCVESSYVHLSAPSVQVLSAHGKLEKVVLSVKSITTCAITTFIDNSPNLVLLYVVTRGKPLSDENGANVDQKDYKDRVLKTFSCHKLITAGDFEISQGYICYDTNLNSLWSDT